MKKIFLVLIVLDFFLTGCEKETPIVSDSAAPEITLTISTTGWSHTFKSTDNYGGIWELRLWPGADYTYTVSVKDPESGLKSLNYRITRVTNGYYAFTIDGAPVSPIHNVTSTANIYTINAQLYESYLMRGGFKTGSNMNSARSFSINITAFDNSDPNNGSQINIPITVPFSGPYGWINIVG